VAISPAFGEIPKGLVERGGSLPLAFHAFHSPGISTALRFVDSGRTPTSARPPLRHVRVLKKFAAGGACPARLPFLQSPDPCESRLQILALVSDFQLELPPLKAHQHAAELLPGDLSTIDV